MYLSRIRFLFFEIYKTIESINPHFMKKKKNEMKKHNPVVRDSYKLNILKLNIHNYFFSIGQSFIRIA